MTYLESALTYRAWGWSVIPVREKRAACEWKRHQSERPSESQLRRMFTPADLTGVAVILGQVSGGLACRDFDQEGSYEKWTSEHPHLAPTLPSVSTARGAHVYFVAKIDGCRKLGDGELRGSGHYCVLPPSLHPNGFQHMWILEPKAGRVPAADPTQGGLDRNLSRCHRAVEPLESLSWRDVRCGKERRQADVADFEKLALSCIPNRPSKNHESLFHLARGLFQFSSDDRERGFRLWHEGARVKGVLDPSLSREDYRQEFIEACSNARIPLGAGNPVDVAWECAKCLPATTPMQKAFEDRKYHLLCLLCQELQRIMRDLPFYLSCPTVVRLLKLKEDKAAWRMLRALELHGFIKTVTKSQSAGLATRYQYIQNLEECSP